MGVVESRSRAKGLLDRLRTSLSRAGEKSAEGLRRTRGAVSGALGNAVERLRESEAGERLKSALDTQRAIKRATDAQARGNARMAFRLLEEELAAKPDDEKLALAFWNVAASMDRAGDAAEAVAGLARRRASRGEHEDAAGLWIELVAAVPEARLDAASLIRIVPALESLDRERAADALRLALHPDTSGLTPGLAVRAAELARSLDPPSAVTAARVALASPDIDASRRKKLEALALELEAEESTPGTPAEAPPPAQSAAPRVPGPEPDPVSVEGDFSELVIEETLEVVDSLTRFAGIKVMQAAPLGLTEEGLRLAVDGGRRALLAYEKIQALGVGEVAGADGGRVLIDLALNWHDPGDGPLRVVRLRGDRFEPEEMASEITGPQTLRGFLAQLLSRSEALPLPDVDGALGDPLHVFEDEAAYQREVLQVG